MFACCTHLSEKRQIKFADDVWIISSAQCFDLISSQYQSNRTGLLSVEDWINERVRWEDKQRMIDSQSIYQCCQSVFYSSNIQVIQQHWSEFSWFQSRNPLAISLTMIYPLRALDNMLGVRCRYLLVDSRQPGQNFLYSPISNLRRWIHKVKTFYKHIFAHECR